MASWFFAFSAKPIKTAVQHLPENARNQHLPEAHTRTTVGKIDSPAVALADDLEEVRMHFLAHPKVIQAHQQARDIIPGVGVELEILENEAYRVRFAVKVSHRSFLTRILDEKPSLWERNFGLFLPVSSNLR